MTAVFAGNTRISKKIGYAAISLGCLTFVFFFVELGSLRETLFSVSASTLALGTALILASFLYHAAMRDEPLPRTTKQSRESK